MKKAFKSALVHGEESGKNNMPPKQIIFFNKIHYINLNYVRVR